MRGDDGSSLLNFKWQEGGGPPVIVPTRRGFGSKLISATSPNVRFNYLPEGLSCEIGVKLGAEIPPK
jgi:two-component sensor histidine kinase